ncbi:hypothetical protein M9Y10_039335 [Tritrichomonas musculus]|uniref:BTB domain-containing protein n=1 Tax=Tritrichomonas musculus TaxID=1915356 RepID=A0ABR2KAX0_9EUKA
MSKFAIKPSIRSDKNLVYKGKKYPVNFSTLKKYSNFFFNKKKDFKNLDDIEISENLDLSEDSIQNFVLCCQNESFNITDENVFSLRQLSIFYEVPELITITNNYIQDNQEKLIFQSILFKSQHQNEEIQFDVLKYDEEIISADFFKYINNEQLLTLPIPVLYRILNRSVPKLSEIESEKQNQIIEFLFKCLDKHKRKASVLFSIIDFDNVNCFIFSRLIDHYSDVFDFGMIDSKCLMKTVSHLLSELNKLKFEFSSKIKELNQLVEDQKEIIKKEQLKMKEQEEINKKQFDSLLDTIREERQKERQEWQNSFNQIKEQTQKELENIKKRKQILYNDNQHFSGIVNYLRNNSSEDISSVINITASSNLNKEKYIPNNLVLFNDNKKNFLSDNKQNSWFCFDFKNCRVILMNYTIRTARMPTTNDCHPKSWVIEGSIDNETWEKIDEVNDCSELNGESLVYTFTVKNQSSKEYQYIRMKQTGKSWSNQDYLAVDSFELFGILI